MLKISGVPQMQAEIRKIAKQYPKRVRRAIYLVGEEVMGRSKELFVPVDRGNLRASGHTFLDRERLKTNLVYGGPVGSGGTQDEEVNYAIVQHENLEYSHPPKDRKAAEGPLIGGGPKYLERPLVQAAPRIPSTIAKLAALEGRPESWQGPPPSAME